MIDIRDKATGEHSLLQIVDLAGEHTNGSRCKPLTAYLRL